MKSSRIGFASPLGLKWCHAGTVERTALDVERIAKGKSLRTTRVEKLPYVTLRDFSRYPGPVLKELSKRLPRRLRVAPAALAKAA